MNGDVLRMSPLGISTVTSPHTVIKKYDDGSEDWKITADYQYIANRCLMVKKPVTKTVEKQQEIPYTVLRFTFQNQK